ncbi:uncharacterized protein BDZ83DRAFT_645957 [Colletotrichum acutatum]|uniref:Uncharacterized protein n=1 Tax=Glomerella acutata TaxID=27357 RepID=A0AAD8XQ48_GLOAC|nr:uncharacterized protein BDZ83DRAFT_645957 [Colletotrichum acutatum]KAK1731446.1 hypothetical protein BDZ83DRAFT_645957 [Colletotrichum acutatum]
MAMGSVVGLRGQRCPQRPFRTVPAPTNYLAIRNTQHARSEPPTSVNDWSVFTTSSRRTNTPPAAFIRQSTPPTFDLHTRADSFVRNATDIQCQIRGPFGCLNAHLLRGRQAYQEADVTCHLVDEMRGRSPLESSIGTATVSSPRLAIIVHGLIDSLPPQILDSSFLTHGNHRFLGEAERVMIDARLGSKSQDSPISKLHQIYERSLPQSPDHLHGKHQKLGNMLMDDRHT